MMHTNLVITADERYSSHCHYYTENSAALEMLEQSHSWKGSGTNRKYSVVVTSHAMSTT